MATKTTKKTARKSSKQSSKKSARSGGKRATPAKKGAKKIARKSSPAKKADRGSKRKPSKRIAGAQINSIQIVPYDGPDAEDNVTCRPKSSLNLFPDIIKRVDGDNDPTDGRIRLTFVLNDPQAIYFSVPGCNPDGFFYIPEQSSNIASIGGPDYLGVGAIKKIRVKIFSPNPLKVIPFTLAFRLRFEENFNLTQKFNPRKKRGSIRVL